VPVQEALVQAAVARGVPLVSEIELFAWAVHRLTPQAALIAITGSNGKTTTTALVGALCRAAGRRTAVAGNISPAALDALMSAIDSGDLPAVWVLELSSFQLETTHTLAADAATLLNVSEDHLDRYDGLDDYTAASKAGLSGRGRDGRQSRRSTQPGGSAQRSRCVSFGLGPTTKAGDYGVVDGWLVRGDEKLIASAPCNSSAVTTWPMRMAALALCEAIGIEPQASCRPWPPSRVCRTASNG
jgi:UDP-N-acetylmuramoylalanine--D-glutamate ligase